MAMAEKIMMTAEKCKKMEDTSEKCGMAERLMRCMMADKEGELDEESEKKCHEMWKKMLHEKEDEMKRKCMMMKKEYNEQEAEKSKLDYYVAKCKKGEDEDAKMCEMAEFKMKCMDEEVMEKMPKEMQMKCK